MKQAAQASVDDAAPMPAAGAGGAPAPKRNFAARLFGYDVACASPAHKLEQV